MTPAVDIRRISPGSIRRDAKFQPRTYGGGWLHDPAEVERMIAAGRIAGHPSGFDPAAWDPPDVWDDGASQTWLLCGFHRLALADATGTDPVDVRIHTGDADAAMRIATRGNLKTRAHDPLEEATIYRRLFESGMSWAAIAQELDRRDPAYYERRAALAWLSPVIADEVPRKAIRVEYGEVSGDAARAGATAGAQGWLRDLARDTRARVEVFRALVRGVIRKSQDGGGATSPSDQLLMFDVPPDAVVVAAKEEMKRIGSALGIRDAWRKLEAAGQALVKRLPRGDDAEEVVAAVDRARLEIQQINAGLGTDDIGTGAPPMDGVTAGSGWSAAEAVAEGDKAVATGGIAARPVMRRWVGNKEWILPTLLPMIRSRLKPGSIFVDPFGGSGAVTAGLAPEHGVLGEASTDIINVYRALRDDAPAVSTALTAMVHATMEATGADAPGARVVYEAIRADRTTARASRAAARIIYLVAASFNGIYRVNRKGEFNVPWGARPNPALPTEADLVTFGRALAGVTVIQGDFRVTADRAKQAGDVLYMDPPYDGMFDIYVPAEWRFDVAALVATAVAARDRGVYVILSQPDHLADVWEKAGGSVTRYVRAHKVGGKAGRRLQGGELLVEMNP